MPHLEQTSSDETTPVSNVKLDTSIRQPLVSPASSQHVIHRKGAGKTAVPFEMEQDSQEYRDDASDGTAPTVDDSMDMSDSLSAEEEALSYKEEMVFTAGSEASSNSAPASVHIQTLKLIFGAGGIYMAFLYNGLLQEDVFRHKSSAGDGSSFNQAWLLSVMEAAANVVVGFLGRQSYTCTDPTANLASLPQKHFVISGAAQVLSKSFKSLALANGLSFPIATLAKSGKMAPVMIGSLLLGGASYSMREYLQVVAIIAGTAVVSMGKSGKSGEVTCTVLGIAFIVLSLSLDGVTGGVQKGLMRDMAQRGMKPRPYDLMYYTNAYMMIVAGLIAIGLGEFQSGLDYIKINREILPMILKFSLCSAVGQSFIFYTIAHFDPLVCTTVTTTRKIFSVVLSIVFNGHALSLQGWSGVLLASSGIVSEVYEKYNRAKNSASKAIALTKSASQEQPDEEMASLVENSGITKKESKEA